MSKQLLESKPLADITFEHVCDESTQLTSKDKVELVAEFNDWLPIKMKYVKKIRVFRAKIRLPQNQQFHFRYRINLHHWYNEHFADSYSQNPFITTNSVF